MNILYTTEAVVEGGRTGHGQTSDGRLAVELSVPKELGGDGGPGTNPEQLFAVGYAACFHSGLLSVARGRKLDASDSFTERGRANSAMAIRFAPVDGGFGSAVRPRAELQCSRISDGTSFWLDARPRRTACAEPPDGENAIAERHLRAHVLSPPSPTDRRVITLPGQCRPERHNQGECCCDAPT